MKPKTKKALEIFFILLMGIGAVDLGLWVFHRGWLLNFGEVIPGYLYRSGEFHSGDLNSLVKKYGIKTIICLKGKENREVEEQAKKLGLNLVSVRLHAERPPGPDRTWSGWSRRSPPLA